MFVPKGWKNIICIWHFYSKTHEKKNKLHTNMISKLSNFNGNPPLIECAKVKTICYGIGASLKCWLCHLFSWRIIFQGYCVQCRCLWIHSYSTLYSECFVAGSELKQTTKIFHITHKWIWWIFRYSTAWHLNRVWQWQVQLNKFTQECSQWNHNTNYRNKQSPKFLFFFSR